MSKKSRIFWRRERRKDKASGYARGIKESVGRGVGHGGRVGQAGKKPRQVRKPWNGKRKIKKYLAHGESHTYHYDPVRHQMVRVA